MESSPQTQSLVMMTSSWPLRPARPSERFLSTFFESLDGFSLTFCKKFSSFNMCPSWVRRVGCCGTPSFGIWLHCSETSKERSTSWRPLWSQAEEVASTSVDRERLLEGCGPFPAVHPMSDAWMSKEKEQEEAFGQKCLLTKSLKCCFTALEQAMAAQMREIHEVMFSPSPCFPNILTRPFSHVHATKRQLTRPPGHQPLALQRSFKLSIQPPLYWHLLPMFRFLPTLSSKLLGFFQSSNGIGRLCLLIWSTIANWQVISEKIPRFTFLGRKGPRWWTGVLASSHQRTGFSQPLALQPRMECICQQKMCVSYASF